MSIKWHFRRNTRLFWVILFSIPVLAFAGSTDHDARVLWISAAQSVFKVSPVNGTPELELADLTQVQALAVDETSDQIWLYGNKHLSAYDAQGDLLVSKNLPNDIADDDPAGMAVDGNAGNLWLGINGKLYRLDLDGKLQTTLDLHGDIQALTLDPTLSHLWVAVDHALRVLNKTGGTVFTITLHHQVGGLAYDASLDQVWVISNKTLQRYDASGNLVFTCDLTDDVGNLLAPDGQGNLWSAGNHALYYISQSGAVEFTLAPFANESRDVHDEGYNGGIIALVADPLNNTAWVANDRYLEQYATDSTLEQTIDIRSFTGTEPCPDRSDHWNDGHSQGNNGCGKGGESDWWNKLLGRENGIHHVALYVDTIPPTMSITSPSNGLYTNHTQLPLVLTYSDLGSGVDPSSIKVTNDGVIIPENCVQNSHATGATCTPKSPLADGVYDLKVTVADYAGNVSQPASVYFTVDTVPPTIIITQPTNLTIDTSSLTITGNVSEAATLTINGINVPLSSNLQFSDAVTLAAGNNTYTFVATDLAGNVATLSQTYVYSTVLNPPNSSLITIGDPTNGQATVTGLAGAVGAGDKVIITNTRTGQNVTVTADSSGAFTATIPAQWGDPITLIAQDPNNPNNQSMPTQSQAGTIPPSPATVAPSLTDTGMTPFADATAFLYTGSNPIQVGVAVNTIQPYRAAVIRGQVEDTSTNPISGVVVSVLNHPEFGYTVSRADGSFDLAINGGQTYTLEYQKTGYLLVQRNVPTPWRDYAYAPTVALIQPAAQASSVSFGASAPAQFVMSTPVTDVDGTRQVGVFIPADTQAAMTLPDGSQAPLTVAHLRITEYTVGPQGQAAMPAELPVYSTYTFALDYQLDEAVAQQATQVTFSNPVYTYVNNFLNFPVGVVVPSGSYDPVQAQWIPSANGVVIQILGIDGVGDAEVDVSGSGQPADAATLASLGFTSTELAYLASNYSAGTTLWRVPANHFSTYDYNWLGVTYDAGALSGGSPITIAKSKTNPCIPGCIVGALHQTLGEQIPVTGISTTLNYNSAAALPGGSSLVIPLTGPSNSYYQGLQSVELRVDVAGQTFIKDFPPDPNQIYTYEWNGLDGYGRRVAGSVPATVTITYITDINYVVFHSNINTAPVSFDTPSWTNGTIIATRHSNSISVANQYPPIMLSNPQVAPMGNGIATGWDLNSDAWYDFTAGILHQGNGSTRDISTLSPVVAPVANGIPGFDLVAIGPDGTAYASTGNAIYRVSPSGGPAILFTTIASPAVIGALRVSPDGSLYALDTYNGQIDSISTAGSVSPVVNGLAGARSFAVLISGGFVVSECGRIVKADSVTGQTTIAGLGCNSAGNSGDGGPALQAAMNPFDIDVDQNGAIDFVQLLSAGGGSSIRHIAPDGTVTTLAGGGTTAASQGVGLSARLLSFSTLTALSVLSDGAIYTADRFSVFIIDPQGVLTATAGGGTTAVNALPAAGAAANSVRLAPAGLTTAPDGTLYIADTANGLFALRAALPVGYGNEFEIPSSDGSIVYSFDGYGRLQRVINSLNGTTLNSYSYNPEGGLVGITDAFGRSITINRDANNHATAIVSPDGQTTQLSVDPNGDLTNITDPAGDTWSMGYGIGGLLTTFTDPLGQTEHYTYDESSRLTQVQEPNDGGWQISRKDSGPSSYTVTLTSGAGRVSQYKWNPGDFVCGRGFGGWITTCFQSSMETIAPDGTVTAENDPLWGNSQAVLEPDSTLTTTTSIPDPRFGMMAPLPQIQTQMPGQSQLLLTNNSNVQRQVSLGNGGTFDVTALTQTADINGQNYIDTYNGANLTWTSTTPAGRSIVTQVNAIGQPLQVTIPGVESLGYSYDPAGRLTDLTLGSGSQARTIMFTYYPNGPSQGFLESATDPLGRTLNYAYDAAGRVTSETLPDNEQVLFGYDADGNLTSVTPPSRPAHTFDYTSVNDVADYTPPSVAGIGDTATHYSYNVDRQLTGIALPDGGNVNLAYDAGGRLSTVTIPTGTYQYNYAPSTGQLASIAGQDGETVNYSWSGFLNAGVTWSGPVSGSVTRTYGDDFRVYTLKPTDSYTAGVGIQYGYDADGFITSVDAQPQYSGEFSDGNFSISHDPQNGLITATNLGGITSSIQYDSFGEPEAESFNIPTAQVSVLASVSPSTFVSSSVFNVTGTVPTSNTLVIKDTPISGSATTQSYPADANGRISGTFTLLTGTNTLKLNVEDGAGNVLGSTQTGITYSPPQPVGYVIGGLEGVDDSGDLFFGWGMANASMFPTHYELRAGTTTPNLLNELQDSAVWLAAAPDGTSYFIDQNGILQHDSYGSIMEVADLISYGLAPVSMTVSEGNSIYVASLNGSAYYIYAFSQGQISNVPTPSGCLINRLGSSWFILHDSAYGLTAGCQTSTGETVFLINSDGSSSVLASNPTNYTQYALSPTGEVCFIDSSGQGIDCQKTDGSTETFASNMNVYDLEFDNNGQLYYLGDDATIPGDQNIFLVSGQTATALISDQPPVPIQGTLTVTAKGISGALYAVSYTRDNVGRITAKNETVNGVTITWGYEYDQQGRLVSVSENGTVIDTYGYDPNGNRISVNGLTIATYDNQDRMLTYGSNSYSYNANGEMTGITTPAGSSSYAYNALGNLTDVTLGNGQQIHYVYDGQNRLVGKEVNGTLTEGFLYDGQLNPIAETNSLGQIVEQFVYGTRPNVPDYIIIAGKVYRVITDQVGSPVLIVDASNGQIAEQISYDAWGNVTSDSNPGFQPFGFAGGISDSDTGLIHFGAREYDPQTGRWVSKDPILFAGGETSLYGYTGNDPVNIVDPSGLCWVRVAGLDSANAQTSVSVISDQQLRLQVESNTLGIDGLWIDATPFALNSNGTVIPNVNAPGAFRTGTHVAFQVPVNIDLNAGSPSPYGYQWNINIPPQEAKNGNSADFTIIVYRHYDDSDCHCN